MSPERKARELSVAKAKKVKLVRDSFCMPKDEYAQIELLKQRVLTLGKAVKKSELLRAGVLALVRADDGSLQTYLAAVPNLKTGRPSTRTAVEMELDVETDAEAEADAEPAPVPAVAQAPARKAAVQAA